MKKGGQKEKRETRVCRNHQMPDKKNFIVNNKIFKKIIKKTHRHSLETSHTHAHARKQTDTDTIDDFFSFPKSTNPLLSIFIILNFFLNVNLLLLTGTHLPWGWGWGWVVCNKSAVSREKKNLVAEMAEEF